MYKIIRPLTRVNAFADCTEDHQFIHVDVEAAKNGPFGGTIAHGYLTLSLLSYFGFQNDFVPAGIKTVVNYGLNKARFLNCPRGFFHSEPCGA